MKTFKSVLACAAVLALVAGVSVADELTSGPGKGKGIGAFQVVKIGGAADDGVQVGQQLCYRCKYGSRPMVMVFTRNQGETVTKLTTQLNEAAGKHRVKAFVNLLGEDREELEAAAKKLAGTDELPNVPVVVPIEFDNGPKNYGTEPRCRDDRHPGHRRQGRRQRGHRQGRPQRRDDPAESWLRCRSWRTSSRVSQRNGAGGPLSVSRSGPPLVAESRT